MSKEIKLEIKNFYKEYINSLKGSLDKVNLTKLSQIAGVLIRQFKIKKKIFV